MNADDADLLRRLVDLGCEAQADVIGALCDALERLPEGTAASAGVALTAAMPQTDVRARAARLLRDAAARGLSPRTVAWTWRAACHAEADRRHGQAVELVWTGPPP